MKFTLERHCMAYRPLLPHPRIVRVSRCGHTPLMAFTVLWLWWVLDVEWGGR